MTAATGGTRPDPAALPALLVSLQLTDSAFPSGLYTMSHGLEGFTQHDRLDPDTVADLIADLLRHSVGPAESTALALAHRAAGAGAWPQVAEVDCRLHAVRLTAEPRRAAVRVGGQLLDLARQVFGGPGPDTYGELVAAGQAPGTQSVVAAVVYAAAGVPAEQAVAGDLFAIAASMVGAALRLRVVDHRQAQVVLRGLAPLIEDVTWAALRRDLADLGGCTPVADIMSGRHERAAARLFAT